jgi:FtsH-binding integral membrane protein
MFDNKRRKEERLKSHEGTIITDSKYNLIIGIMLIYGFLMNGILAYTTTEIVLNINPLVVIIGYFISCFIGSMLVVRSHNPVISFVGYNLIAVPIGLLLSVCLPGYSMDLIASAFLMTGLIAGIMMFASTVKPELFLRMGPALGISLLIGIVVEIIAMLCGYGGDLFNWLFVIIFSLYIGYDWSKAQMYPKTVDNAIDSAVDLYLDLINLFLRLLELLSRRKK